MASEKSVRTKSRKSLRNLSAHAVGAKQAGSVRGGKLIDKASSKLSQACCKGTHLPEVTIE